MTGRDFLKSLREDNFALKPLEDRIVELRNNLYRVKTINYSENRVDGGVPSDIADRIGMIQSLIDEANDRWDSLIKKKRMALSIIFEIKDGRYQAILEERYINMRSWSFIARRIGYEESQTYLLHKKGLNVFDRIFDEREKVRSES
jgi:hypothetical protein